MSLASESAEIYQGFLDKRDNNDLSTSEKSELWVETREAITELFLEEDWELSDRTIREEVKKAFEPLDLLQKA